MTGSLSIWEGLKEEDCMFADCSCLRRIPELALEMGSAIFKRTSKDNKVSDKVK